MNDHIPDWFYNQINDLFQNMYMIGLPNTPPAENLDKTFQVWVNILWGDSNRKKWEVIDLARFTASFRFVMEKAERFPTPAEVLKSLPERNSPLLKSLALPAPVSKLTDQESKARSEKLKQATAKLVEQMDMQNYLAQKARERKEREQRLKSDFNALLAAVKFDPEQVENKICAQPCSHTGEVCAFYTEMVKMLNEMQAWEVPYSALTSPHHVDAVPSDPEPTKKRRKKATV